LRPLLVLLGPTASGKTNLATRICSRINGELISADSRQVYRGMDIGTGKDLGEYVVEGKNIPYHLIDIQNAGEQYNVHEFQKDFATSYDGICRRNSVPVVCGGSGFYLHAILKGHVYASVPVNESLRNTLEQLFHEELIRRFDSLDSVYHALADTSTRKRLIRAIEISEYLISNPDIDLHSGPAGYESIIYGLNPPVEIRRERITNRLQSRLENGLIEEVQKLLENGLTPEQLIYYGLEYKYVTLYLKGEMTYQDMVSRLETEIHRFAKRQMTFFRKMEKDGVVINWLEWHLPLEQQVEIIISNYQNRRNS